MFDGCLVSHTSCISPFLGVGALGFLSIAWVMGCGGAPKGGRAPEGGWLCKYNFM